jgi:H+/Cl- antiporter ClcA
MHSLPPIKPPAHTQFEDIGLNHEIIFIVILGVLCAKVAVLFNHILLKMIFLRVKLKNPFISNRWKWTSTVTLFISIIGFPIVYLHLSEKNIDNMFFTEKKNLGDLPNGHMWSYPDTTFNLITYCICKFFFIILSICCPIPNGIFAPIFSLGAGFGRLYGHILMLIGDKIGVQLIRYEGIYAVVGAAAIGGSSTKTISTIVIVFEMLGQVQPLMIPVSVGLLVAYWCTTGVAMGIFDVIIEFKNFPFMPTLGSLQSYSLKASDIMNKNFMHLS